MRIFNTGLFKIIIKKSWCKRLLILVVFSKGCNSNQELFILSIVWNQRMNVILINVVLKILMFGAKKGQVCGVRTILFLGKRKQWQVVDTFVGKFDERGRKRDTSFDNNCHFWSDFESLPKNCRWPRKQTTRLNRYIKDMYICITEIVVCYQNNQFSLRKVQFFIMLVLRLSGWLKFNSDNESPVIPKRGKIFKISVVVTR